MEEDKIRKYAVLMRELGLSGLEINENGVAMRLECGDRGKVSLPHEEPQAPAQEAPVSGLNEIRSPMIGVYYAASSENAAPFVKKGDRIRKGDILCIIESMKLMNEIVAEQSGVVEEICVENGDVVDFGRVLFRLKEVRE